MKDLRKARRCFKRWMKKNPEEGLLSVGQKMVVCYEPKADFHPNLNKWSWTNWNFDGKKKTDIELHWRVLHGLHTLLHEIMHIYYEHVYENQLPLRWSEYMCEIEAWIGAEKECHHLGIPFDYVDADDALERRRLKLGLPPVIAARWKYLKEEKEEE